MSTKTITHTLIEKHIDLFLVGETLVDIFIDYQGNKHILFGGSPANICVNTNKMGIKSILCTSIGQDTYGQFISSKFEEYHIDTSFINICSHKTSSVKVNQTSDSPTPTFYRGCDNFIRLSDKMIQAVAASKIFHFSFWPLTMEPSKSTVLKLIDVAKSNDTLVSFDPNIHKDLMSTDSISNDTLFELLKSVDIIKPSLDDLERLFNVKATKDEFMDKLEAFDIGLIMMTLGKDGVYISNNKHRTYYPTETKIVIDSTGAGDAFWSGFYAGYLQNLSIKDSIHLAQITSGFAIKQIGTIIDNKSIEVLKTKFHKH